MGHPLRDFQNAVLVRNVVAHVKFAKDRLQVDQRVKGAPGSLHESAKGTVEWVRGNSVRVKWDQGGTLTGPAHIFKVVARHVEAKNFPNDKALKEYLSKHPGADKAKHKVVEVDEDMERIKKELKPTQDIAKGQQKSDKGKAERKEEKGKKDDDAHAEKLKKELMDWKNAES
jgi:hypothetical protein